MAYLAYETFRITSTVTVKRIFIRVPDKTLTSLRVHDDHLNERMNAEYVLHGLLARQRSVRDAVDAHDLVGDSQTGLLRRTAVLHVAYEDADTVAARQPDADAVLTRKHRRSVDALLVARLVLLVEVVHTARRATKSKQTLALRDILSTTTSQLVALTLGRSANRPDSPTAVCS